MENNKDIANQIKKVLEGGSKSPENSLWEKVNKTLDEKDAKRKRAFYWRMGSFIFIPLLLVFIYFQIDEKQNIETQLKNTKTISSEVNRDSLEFETNNSNSDTLQNIKDNSNVNSASEVDVNKNTSIVDENNTTKQTTKTNSKNSKKSKHDSMEGFKVKSTYYYYNSETNKHIETKDKAIIDSLIRASKEEIKDSI